MPCDGCAARKVDCMFSRYCVCGNATSLPAMGDAPAEGTSPRRPRDGAVPLSFLLNSTDDTQEYITETAVGEEPEGALVGPICTVPFQNQVLDEEPLFDYIDPTLLLPPKGCAALLSSLPYVGEEQDMLSTLLSSRCHEHKLTSRIEMLESQLATSALSNNHSFEAASIQHFFSTSDVYSFATTFCRKHHYRYPVIHWPTFVLEDAPLPLLLVVALTGASYSYQAGHELEHINNARKLYPLADAYVFEQLDICLSRGVYIAEAVQLCQAALLMYGLDTLLGRDVAMQHMAITKRLPALVSAVRSLSLIDTQHTISEDWQLFVQRESIIRLVSWTFCADCLATLTCNNPPLFSLQEMTGNLPCDPDLWDADSAVSFELMLSSRKRCSSHSLKDLIPAFVGQTSCHDIELGNLPLFDLHMLLCAFQPLIFNLHITFTLPSQSSKLLQALDTWRQLWDKALTMISDDYSHWLGVARYVPGIECLSRRVIEVAVSDEAGSSRYLRRQPWFGTRDIHEFIRNFVAEQ